MEKICPKCGKTFTDEPALSREDNETYICPDCGVREALASIGIVDDEADQILQRVNQERGRWE